MTTERPRFELLKTYDDFEVRRYDRRVVAQTEVEGARLERDALRTVGAATCAAGLMDA